jgi:hypothetical protein
MMSLWRLCVFVCEIDDIMYELPAAAAPRLPKRPSTKIHTAHHFVNHLFSTTKVILDAVSCRKG